MSIQKLQIKKLINVDFAKLVFLDTFRGIAAIYVMICHGAWQLWDYTPALQNEQQTALYPLLYLFVQSLQYAHFAVIFFFVLSGFVIHLKYSINVNLNCDYNFKFKSYFVKRFRRIYPPFVFALVLTALLDNIMLNLGFKETHPTAYSKIYEGELYLSIKTFFGNLFFLNGHYYPTYGSNGPLWSLMYEWWFYLLYPCFFLIIKNFSFILASAVACITYAIFNFFSLPFEPHFSLVFSMFLLWWVGAILAELFVRGLLPFRTLAFSTVLIPLSLIVYKFKLLSAPKVDLLFAVGIASLVGLLLLRPKWKFTNSLRKFKFLGSFSYTLYVVHMPIQKFSASLIIIFLGIENRPQSIVYYFMSIPLILLIAWLLHFLLERPFTSLRVDKKISPNKYIV